MMFSFIGRMVEMIQAVRCRLYVLIK